MHWFNVQIGWPKDPVFGSRETKFSTFQKISKMFDVLPTFANLSEFASWHYIYNSGPRWQSGNTLASHLWGRGKLVVACRWSSVYTTEPWRTVCTGFLCPSNYPSWYDLYGVESDIKPQINKQNLDINNLKNFNWFAINLSQCFRSCPADKGGFHAHEPEWFSRPTDIVHGLHLPDTGETMGI